MGVIAFNYLKFDAEKKKGPVSSGAVEVKHNLEVTDVEKAAFKVGGANSDALKIEFQFDILYGKGLGKLTMLGEVVYTDTKDIVEESVKGWKSDKKLNPMLKVDVHKFVYNKCIVRCIDLADALNLPSPVPMPKFNYTTGDGKEAPAKKK